MITKIGVYREPRNKKRPWVVRWYGEYDPATDKQHRYSKAFKLKVEAEDFQATKKQAIRQGGRRDKSKEALKSFCDKWVRLNNSHRPATQKLYSYTIERLLSYFGADCLLRRITTDRAELFIAELKPLKGDELSNWTKHRTLRNCKTMFQSAVRWGCISFNPFG